MKKAGFTPAFMLIAKLNRKDVNPYTQHYLYNQSILLSYLNCDSGFIRPVDSNYHLHSK